MSHSAGERQTALKLIKNFTRVGASSTPADVEGVVDGVLASR